MNYSDIRLTHGYTIEEKLAELTEHELHVHDALELSIPLDRPMMYPLLDRVYYAEPGDVFLFRPFEPHWNLTREADKPARWVMVLFSPAVVSSVPRGYALLAPFYMTDMPPLIPARSPHAKAIKRLAEQAVEEASLGRPDWDVQQFTLLLQILVHVHRHYLEQSAERQADPSLSSLVAAIEYIIAHWSYEIDMDEVMRQTKLKKTGFYTKFKAVAGLTPNEFLARLRLQHASHMLRHTNRSITEIALECGFGSSSYFIKVFKQFRGMPPRQFRAKH